MPETAPESQLVEVGSLFQEEYTRSTQGGLDPNIPKPVDIDTFRSACAELEVNEILPESLMNLYLGLIESGDTKKIDSVFPKYGTVCLAVIPFTMSGVPIERKYQEMFSYFKVLEVGPNGLTLGIESNPGYYFKYLPVEIQQQCTFEVPTNESGFDLKELKIRFINAFAKLKKLIEKYN
jgi:hypothetical protein